MSLFSSRGAADERDRGADLADCRARVMAAATRRARQWENRVLQATMRRVRQGRFGGFHLETQTEPNVCRFG